MPSRARAISIPPVLPLPLPSAMPPFPPTRRRCWPLPKKQVAKVRKKYDRGYISEDDRYTADHCYLA